MDVTSYYTRTDWKTAGLVGFVAILGYGGSLAPTITLEYSGQLIVAADHLGVARPPGYPIWHLLAKAFTTVFAFVEYRGHPNPAWAVNLLSTVFGALTCGAIALLVSSEARHLLGGPTKENTRYAASLGAVSAFAAALLFGFSQTMWSQSVIAETHTLTNFYFVLLLATLLRWTRQRTERAIYLLAMMYGFGLSISHLLVLMAPVMLLAAAFVSRKTALQLGAAFAGFSLFIAAEFALGPHSPGIAASVLATTIGVLALLMIPSSTRPASFMLPLMLIGLLPYIYLPLAASHNPPMNMGNAQTWEGFWHVLNRGQYERLSPVNPIAHASLFMDQLRWYIRLASSQFTTPLFSIALLPVVTLPFLRPSARPSMALLLLALCLFSVLTLLGTNPRLDLQTTALARVIFIPSFAIFAMLIGCGLAILLDGLGERRAWNHKK